MLKIWAKTVKDNKPTAQYTVEIDPEAPAEEQLSEALREICYALDLSNPIIQAKHIRDMDQYRLTRFLPESFIEPVDFDRLELNIFDDSPKAKNNRRA